MYYKPWEIDQEIILTLTILKTTQIQAGRKNFFWKLSATFVP